MQQIDLSKNNSPFGENSFCIVIDPYLKKDQFKKGKWYVVIPRNRLNGILGAKDVKRICREYKIIFKKRGDFYVLLHHQCNLKVKMEIRKLFFFCHNKKDNKILKVF